MSLLRRRLMNNISSPIPGYTICDYVSREDNTLAYFTVPMTSSYSSPMKHLRCTFRVHGHGVNEKSYIYGNWTDSATGGGLLFDTYSNKYRLSTYNSYKQLSQVVDTGIHTIEYKNNNYYLDDTLVIQRPLFSSTAIKTIAIFGKLLKEKAVNETCVWGVDIFEFSYTTNTNIEHELIPVFKDENNTSGLYDIKQDVFYYSKPDASIGKVGLTHGPISQS